MLERWAPSRLSGSEAPGRSPSWPPAPQPYSELEAVSVWGSVAQKHELRGRIVRTSALAPPLSPQLMPLLKLQHAHISGYQELFLIWNGEVRARDTLRLSGHSVAPGTGGLSSEHPNAIISPGATMAGTPNVATLTQHVRGALQGASNS